MPPLERRLLLVPNSSLLGSSERSDCSSIPVNRTNGELSLLKKKKLLQQQQQQQQQEEEEEQNQQQRHCKKQVTFNKSVRQRRIPLARNYPEELRRQLWYTPIESKQLRKNAVATVKLMMKKIELPDDECSRGLEFKSPKKNKIRQERKQDIYWKVLSEQEDLLYSKGEADDDDDENYELYTPPIHEIEEQLSVVYRHASKKCILEALKRGKEDALEVARIWR